MKIRKSYISALIIAGLVVGWMFSDDIVGFYGKVDLLEDHVALSETIEKEENLPNLITQALKVVNQRVPIKITARGVTRTGFDINVISRRNAFVKSHTASEGGWVEAGAILIELDKGTLDADLDAARADRRAALVAYEEIKKRFRKDGAWVAQLAAARADLDAVRSNYESTEKLVERGVKKPIAKLQQMAHLKAAEMRLIELQSLSEEFELSTSYALIKAVDARISKLEEQMDFTKVKSPKSGWLEEFHVEVGETVGENAPIARIIGLQSLILDAPIPQTQISKIRIGDNVDLDIDGAGKRQGQVNKIATSANQATRTFNVEILLDNKDGTLRAGMSAGVSVIIDHVPAFKISPAHLNVDDTGLLSVKTVAANGIVKTVPVLVTQTVGNAAYVSGLRNGALILGMGQAFVSDGTKVTYEIIGETN
jgi:multidrug efflux system membrane fusion protein